MANSVFVSVLDGVDVPVWIHNVEPFMLHAMKKLGFDGEEISVLLCNDSYIAFLNNSYRGIAAPTDVLSFENGSLYADENGIEWKCMGDIIISVDMLPRNAEAFDTDENSELKRLLVHGLLHLNGFEHGDEHIEKGKMPVCDMLMLQEKMLAEFSGEKIIN
ncbi:MAG: rRNA maturation RNase YbeY [Treponema sp.]|nr:rRNA maturation RNase YbeY [Treponema sp.]